MHQIKIKDNAPFEQELRRFKRACDKANISHRFRANLYYEKPTTKRRLLKIAAVKEEYNRNRKYRSL